MRRLSFMFVAAVLAALALPFTASAAAPSAPNNANFAQTWGHTDQPVAAGKAQRTWLWGPQPYTDELWESYAESPDGARRVIYFDKSRMEITHPTTGDQSGDWYVTNGLLTEELITGRMQIGDTTFEQHDPAQVNVAGDANDPNGPTYATFNPLMSYGAIPSGWIINQTVDRAGHVGTDTVLGTYAVTAQDVGAPTKHTVASVFWDFMNSAGTIWNNGGYANGPLFNNPFYATGYPLTEAYWTNVLVGGVPKQVLVQVFERRVLTYTPDNPAGWQVESGNVGQHYYQWRYVDLGNTPLLAAHEVGIIPGAGDSVIASPKTPVHPGAFCAPDGAFGVTVDNTPMACTTTATDSRDRWRAR